MIIKVAVWIVTGAEQDYIYTLVQSAELPLLATWVMQVFDPVMPADCWWLMMNARKSPVQNQTSLG